jgi:hypothetical protein
MATDLFTEIYAQMVNSFGFPWFAWLALFIAFFALITLILEIDFLISALVTSLPLLVFAMYNLISLGEWGLAVLVLILGLTLALSLYRLVFK